MKARTQKFLQQRRFYMALPILAFPFITLIFWALGGGTATPVYAETIQSGINTTLPGAHFEQEEQLWDKFALYERAKRDSLKYEEARRNDPYYVTATLQVKNRDTVPAIPNKLNTSLGSKGKYAPLEENEMLIHQKLQQLSRQLEQPEPSFTQEPERRQTIIEPVSTLTDNSMTEDVDRLEKMMQLMSATNVNDSEMQQIDGMLDKILDIQHPQRIQEKIKSQSHSNQKQVFPVAAVNRNENISLVEAQPAATVRQVIEDSLMIQREAFEPVIQNSFYGLNDEPSVSEEESGSIAAVIHDTQDVVAGSIVKLRLASDVFINGRLIEANQFVYGVCAIAGERLTITINSIRDQHNLLPVALAVYDLDGLEGIYIPGAIARDVAKQSGSQSIQDIQLYSMDNSLGVQAATAGLEAAKGLFTKKAKLIKVTVKSGYQVLLKDMNQKTL